MLDKKDPRRAKTLGEACLNPDGKHTTESRCFRGFQRRLIQMGKGYRKLKLKKNGKKSKRIKVKEKAVKIEESAGYKKLLASVERDEQESPRFHDYRAKLAWVIARASQYAEKTGLEASDILNTWEENRSYWYMNYYQDCNQPNLGSDGVRVFDTTEQALESMGKAGFRCPACNGISKSPYRCTTGLKMPKSEKICDWKVGGLFGDLGKGIHVFLKEKMLGEQIFLPIAWEDKGAKA